jgi:diadenylate cyclase
MLSKVPRLDDETAARIVEAFGALDKILRADVDQLASVDGVGDSRARSIKAALEQIAETSILDGYQ